MTASTAILETHGLSVGYRAGHPLTEPLSLRLHGGELVCLLGPNGAGKSTLLRTLTGLQAPLAGQVRIRGTLLAERPRGELARDLSVVLTDAAHPGMMSVAAVAALGRIPYTGWLGRLGEADRRIVTAALERVGLAELSDRPVGELSDGERQRVHLARALAQDTELIVLDEPTIHLDLPGRVTILELLRGLARDTGRAVLASTHELELALQIADVLWLLTADGHLHAGAPEDLALQGVLQSVFRHAHVVFDAERGGFRFRHEGGRAVVVHGEGDARRWTERALRRGGFRPDATAGHVPVVRVEGPDYHWRIVAEGASREVDSIAALLAVLRGLPPS